MGNLTIPSDLHFVKGLDPVADAFSGTVYSDIIEVMGEGYLLPGLQGRRHNRHQHADR